jgi:hypothetical protein
MTMAATQMLSESINELEVGAVVHAKTEEQDLDEEDSGDEGHADLVDTNTSSKKKKKKKPKKKASCTYLKS